MIWDYGVNEEDRPLLYTTALETWEACGLFLVFD